MTGPEHYAEAERLLAIEAGIPVGDGPASPAALQTIAEAHVHATLALAAATALAMAHELPVADHDAWWAAVGSEPIYREPAS